MQLGRKVFAEASPAVSSLRQIQEGVFAMLQSSPASSLVRPATRLYYLDWLRVIAVFGVFLFHAVHPFDFIPWHIKNGDQSAVVTFFIVFMFPWGMPFFFLLSGAGSWFALRRRTAREFARERFNRLLLPFVVGALLLMPVMLYFEWRHNLQTGLMSGPFIDFLLDRNRGFSPTWFGALGYHLWFLGFLFSFSILCLPAFLWLRGDAGRWLIDRLAAICEHRGAILLFCIPLIMVRLLLHPFFPQEHDWADFFFLMAYFLLGFVLYANERFLQAVRRDWPFALGIGIAAAAGGLAIAISTGNLDVETPPRTLLDVLFWILIGIDGWCWSLFFLFIGMRYLDFTDKVLEYGQDAILPFFVFHQPVIIILAYYAVQWPAGLLLKLLFVVIGSFLVTLGIYEFLIRRSPRLSQAFGMKATYRVRNAQAYPVTGTGKRES
jgi:peptidoglycan/LPS O-acetylase OafA/YrhL